MGFGNFSGGGKRTTVITLDGKSGKMTHWVKDPTNLAGGAREEVGTVFGRVAAIETVERQGKDSPLHFIHVTFDDGHELVKVEMSRYANMTMEFLARLNNTDITKPIALSPWLMKTGTRIGDFVVKKDMLKMTTREVVSVDANGVPTTGAVIDPFYGPEWGKTMPKGQVLKLANGEDAKDAEGKVIVDTSWKRPYMNEQLSFVVARLGQGPSDGATEGVAVPEDVTPEDLSSDDDDHSDRQRQV